MGYTAQFAGLAVQNFVSAAVGIAVAIALVRGFASRRSGTIGNFWVDLIRGTWRLLLPLSIVAAIVLIAGGVVQNLNGFTEVATISGERRRSREDRSPRKKRSSCSARTAAGSTT